MTETQKLGFASAMSDFKSMFPYMKDSLIEQVLRRNNGMVDQTIDDLLAISCVDDEEAATGQEQPSSSQIMSNQENMLRPIHHVTPSRTYPTLSSHLPPGDLTLTPRHQQPPQQKYGQVPVSFLGVQFPIPYTSPLPQQFLRLSEPAVPPNNSQLAAQMAEDREFALLLHNQGFLDQVQSNQEFMRTLNQAERGPSTSEASRRPDEVSIAQRLSETGKATRSKLLKIAKKLNIKRTSKIRQPLLTEDDDEDSDARQPLCEDTSGDEGLIFTDLEEAEAEEEFKTIPRQNTLQEFEANRQRAREVVARQMRGERPPPPPIPPPSPPASPSTLSRDNYNTLDSGTLTMPNQLAISPNLLDLTDPDNIYEDQLVSPTSPEEPIYSNTEELRDSVSNLTMSAMSDASSVYDCDVRNREIHSSTLSSSYLIPIRTFTDEGNSRGDEEMYDNLNCNIRPKEENLIKF